MTSCCFRWCSKTLKSLETQLKTTLKTKSGPSGPKYEGVWLRTFAQFCTANNNNGYCFCTCSSCCWCLMLFPLEEKFAQSVCFLLVDLYLLTFQPEKALHLLTVLDKLSVQGSNKNGKGEVDTNTVCVIKTGMCTTKANPLVCTFKIVSSSSTADTCCCL